MDPTTPYGHVGQPIPPFFTYAPPVQTTAPGTAPSLAYNFPQPYSGIYPPPGQPSAGQPLMYAAFQHATQPAVSASGYQVNISNDVIAQVREEYQRKQKEEEGRKQAEQADREKQQREEETRRREERERRDRAEEERRVKEREELRRKSADERDQIRKELLREKYVTRLKEKRHQLPGTLRAKLSDTHIHQVAALLLDRLLFSRLVELRKVQARRERELKAERDALEGEDEGLLVAKDKEIIRVMDQLVIEQQQQLSQAGMEIFQITNNPDEIAVQMAVLGVVGELMEGK